MFLAVSLVCCSCSFIGETGQDVLERQLVDVSDVVVVELLPVVLGDLVEVEGVALAVVALDLLHAGDGAQALEVLAEEVREGLAGLAAVVCGLADVKQHLVGLDVVALDEVAEFVVRDFVVVVVALEVVSPGRAVSADHEQLDLPVQRLFGLGELALVLVRDVLGLPLAGVAICQCNESYFVRHDSNSF